jgi:hypothetical protein
MRKSIFVGAVITFFSFGCATQANYSLHGFYKSKNNNLNLVSKLAVYKSGNYAICTSTLDHEKEHTGDGNYYCILGNWKQQKNIVTLIADTDEGKLLFSLPENESIAILESAENLANPTTLSILQPSGATIADISVTEVKAGKVNGWGNYQRTEDLY